MAVSLELSDPSVTLVSELTDLGGGNCDGRIFNPLLASLSPSSIAILLNNGRSLHL